MSTSAPAQIELYTNHICPWAHRAHIALSILSLPFTEHIIDLDTPRSAAYLSINPRGLVPTLIYNGEIITESGIVAQFLADQYPGKLQKSSSEEGGALERARTNFFVDAFVTKLVPQIFAGLRAETVEEKAKSAQELVDAVKKELEPLLGNAAPFFGGSSVLTLAEVLDPFLPPIP
jgi:glutathione S-transferase